MAKPFTPKRADGRPMWQVVYDLAAAAEPGATIPYQQLLDELETPDRAVVYRAAGKANKHLWETRQRSLDVVPDVGYRVLLPTEHEAQAKGFQKASRRKLTNAVLVAQATDLSGMTEVQRNAALQFTAGLMLMARAVDRHEEKLARHDDLIKELTERIERVEEAKEEAAARKKKP